MVVSQQLALLHLGSLGKPDQAGRLFDSIHQRRGQQTPVTWPDSRSASLAPTRGSLTMHKGPAVVSFGSYLLTVGVPQW